MPIHRGVQVRGLVAIVSLLTLEVFAQEPAGLSYVIVVSSDVEGSTISRDLLKQIFLKEVDRWGDGQAIAVVDQSLRSPVRASFSRDVLAETPERLLLFWRQKIMSGVQPPKVKASDAKVIEFVASNRGAVGYVVAGTAPADGSVKVLTIVADQ